MTAYSTFQDVVEHTKERRIDFFRLVFGNESGYVCIAYKSHLDRSMREKFFQYPSQLSEMCDDIDKNSLTLTHVYFCPQLFIDASYKRAGDGKGPRVKENVKTCPCLWADLDTCNPQLLQVPASIVVQSSKGRWQAFWRMDESLQPADAEALSMKIAYFHSDQGADRSGWDLTQLLRVPYTPNYKYGDLKTAPIVAVINTTSALYRSTDFDVYPQYEALKFVDNPVPLPEDLPQEAALDILQRYRSVLHPQVFGLFSSELGDGDDWSKVQWKLAKLCSEAGMTPEETFVVVRDAACNKYARDGRPVATLWTEIKKVYVREYETKNLVPTPTSIIPELITQAELRVVQGRTTFIERYIRWASDLTDAAPQYHQAGAFTILSAMLSGSVRLQTSFGTIIPNLWFMILADTTLTRKSTAMDIAMELLAEVSPNAILATDGSPEGILSALKDRTKQPSIYFRDEFTGLLEAITNKDYMAGMAEQFTKLYDGKTIKRLLRKEEIRITEPRFIMFTGGVKTKTQSLLNEEHINSGFIPRFIFITAVADPSRVRPVGPPIYHNHESKIQIKDELFQIDDNYNRPRMIILPDGRTTSNLKPEFEVKLSDDAWRRYNELESLLTNTALSIGIAHLTPVYDRLAKSTLKAAILIAASRQGEKGTEITVELDDILHAIYYCKQWYVYANEIVSSIGKSNDERTIDKIMEFVVNAGINGVSRSDIMRAFHLDSRRAELLLTTIIQRRLVFVSHFSGQPRYVGIG